MEEGEEPNFTHAEETKRQIRREERKKKKTEEFRLAKDTCMSSTLDGSHGPEPFLSLDKPQEDPEAVGDPYKTLFLSRLVSYAVIIIMFRGLSHQTA